MKVVQSMNRAADKYPDQVFMTLMIVVSCCVGVAGWAVVEAFHYVFG